MMGEGMLSSLLLVIVVFAVAVLAFVRGFFYWKRSSGTKDRILMLVMFAISAYATVSFWLFVMEMI